MKISTPYYLIDESRMQKQMDRIKQVRDLSGAKSVLALKCFSSWCAFDFMKDYLVGTTSSSLYEARLGYETFPGETHGYSVAFTEQEIIETIKYCNKITFNSLSQLTQFEHLTDNISVGLRLNPGVGYSHYGLSDTVCEYSRLGEHIENLPSDIAQRIDGVLLHMNCENKDFNNLSEQLDFIERNFDHLLPDLNWLSLGGGIAFTGDGYPLDPFCQRLKALSEKYQLQIYLEPGEASVTQSTSLIVTVLDKVDNGLPTLIVDAGVETHLLDVLVYGFSPQLDGATPVDSSEIKNVLASGKHVYRVSGRTCLSGDVFGTYVFEQPVKVGQELTFSDVAGYSMVKKNFFNGIKMPSICHKKINGEERVVKEFTYEDFKGALS